MLWTIYKYTIFQLTINFALFPGGEQGRWTPVRLKLFSFWNCKKNILIHLNALWLLVILFRNFILRTSISNNLPTWLLSHECCYLRIIQYYYNKKFFIYFVIKIVNKCKHNWLRFKIKENWISKLSKYSISFLEMDTRRSIYTFNFIFNKKYSVNFI